MGRAALLLVRPCGGSNRMQLNGTQERRRRPAAAVVFSSSLLILVCCVRGAAAGGTASSSTGTPSSSSVRRGKVAANAFDSDPESFWQGSSPAAGSWLQVDFARPVTASQYEISATTDVAVAASSTPTAFEVQGSADGRTFVTLDRRFNDPPWSPGEKRTYNFRIRGGLEASFAIFRLVVVKVPGRGGDETYAAIGTFKLITETDLPTPCAPTSKMTVNATVVGSPREHSDVPTPHNTAQIFLNITNVGTMGVNLATGFHVPIRFSWAVQNWGGDWVASPQSNFTIGCWGAFVFTAIGTSNWKSLCGPQLQFKPMPWGLDVIISDVILCPGCFIRGSPGFAAGAVQHKNWMRIDTESAIAATPACGPDAEANLTKALAPLPVPGIERLPACAPFAAGKGAPTCPPRADLQALRVQLRFRFLNASVEPNPNDPSGSAPVSAPRELRINLNLTNTRDKPVPLAGVILPIMFDRAVYVENFKEWIPTLDEHWDLQCFWAQMTTRSGFPIGGLGGACSYLRFTVAESGFAVQFLGGTLCGGCSVAGATGPAEAVFNVKHVSYLQLNNGARRNGTMPPGAAVRPRPAECVPLTAAPEFCTPPKTNEPPAAEPEEIIEYYTDEEPAEGGPEADEPEPVQAQSGRGRGR